MARERWVLPSWGWEAPLDLAVVLRGGLPVVLWLAFGFGCGFRRAIGDGERLVRPWYLLDVIDHGAQLLLRQAGPATRRDEQEKDDTEGQSDEGTHALLLRLSGQDAGWSPELADRSMQLGSDPVGAAPAGHTRYNRRRPSLRL